ncbi:ATP-binding protein [Streptomyces sp. NPDC050287]|uniref:ATP-binding protein n=1 Tax=Streptomyces sp. NPDC050287 TaxID=3365608 RepID=UPI0037B656E5
MKQSAAKTLGVAALGAAFAAAGAGAANAAPAVPDATQALDTVSHTLPAEHLTKELPGGGEALGQAQPTLAGGLSAVQPVVEKNVAQGPTAPVSGLLGGLPVGKGLPTQGLPTQGLPTQGLPTQGLPTQGLPVNALPLG